MMKSTLVCLIVLGLASAALADTYMQQPRGSNCRNREKNQNRQNANRCFNSQNNAAGGYGIANERLQVYAGCVMMIDWTVQHGSGRGENKADFILQAMWASDQGALAGTVRDNELGTGADTDTIAVNTGAALAAAEAEADNAGNADRCRYESVKSFWHCNRRNRNANLYTGKDTPAGNTAQSTRQNDNNVHGLECTEEREYYPYWHPSDFRDLRVYKHNASLCAEVEAESQNVKGKHLCVGDNSAGDPAPTENNEASCAGVGTWTETPAWGIDAPECSGPFMSRINHLGNTGNENCLPEFEQWNWTIPADMRGLVNIRQRYNISTAELSHEADAGDDNNVILTENNPAVQISDDITLQLALNTQQVFRTFQDRSALFDVIAPPEEMSACSKCHIVSVRGGRGNIVQAYPGTEYDFAPNHLRMASGECMSLTWTGTDAWTANDEGQGADLDKYNFVGLPSYDALFPLQVADHEFPPLEAIPAQAGDAAGDREARRIEWIKRAARGCYEGAPNTDTQQDDAPFACLHSLLGPFTTSGTWYAYSSRNTAFSNRSQKMVIHVGGTSSAFVGASVVVGVFVAVAGAVAMGSMFYAKGHPNSTVARIFQNGGSRGSGILSSNGSRGGGGSRGGSHGSRGGGRSSRSGSRNSRGGKSRGSSKGSGYARH